jgi:ribonuclease E
MQPAAPLDGQPVEQMAGGHMPVDEPPFEPHAAMRTDAVAPSPAPAPVIAPPPEPVIAQAPQPVPAEPVPPPPPPAIVIPTISADAPPEKPKRGWWKR